MSNEQTPTPGKPREWWISENILSPKPGQSGFNNDPPLVHVIEKAAYDDLSIKIQRTVNAAYHALLEMSAWLGVPEKKRHAHIEELMSNVTYCAEHDLRHVDTAEAVAERDALAKRVAELEKTLREYEHECETLITRLKRAVAFDERLFYDLMQSYRHAPIANQVVVAERYDAVRDRFARLEPIITAMIECVSLLQASLRKRTQPAPEDVEVKELGERIGFGALMDAAEKGWREVLIENGLPGGEFTVGPCRGTVNQALAKLQKAIGEG